MSQHAPGPWTVEPNDNEPMPIICSNETETIVAQMTTNGQSMDEMKANARLIAAAPDFLAALKESQRAVEELLTEFVSKERAANWGIINDAGVHAAKSIRRAEEGG